MPTMNNMFPSRWLAAADLGDQERTFTISHINQELIGQGEEADQKWVLFFMGCDKGLVLNKTNARAIAACLGDNSDDWIDRKVVLYPTEVQFSGKMVEAIRVKERSTRAANKPGRSHAPAPAVAITPDVVVEDLPF